MSFTAETSYSLIDPMPSATEWARETLEGVRHTEQPHERLALIKVWSEGLGNLGLTIEDLGLELGDVMEAANGSDARLTSGIEVGAFQTILSTEVIPSIPIRQG